MRSPVRYAANRAGRQIARNYVKQQRRNTYVNKQQPEVANSDAFFSLLFVIGFLLFLGLISSL
jgi:hypothetical protein